MEGIAGDERLASIRKELFTDMQHGERQKEG